MKKSTTWQLLETRWDKGFDKLELEEQQAIALYWLEAETMNGGLNQFFHNSSGDLAPLALAGLKQLNCMQTYTVLHDLMLQIFGEHYPTAQDDRFAFLEAIEAKLGPDYDRNATNFIQDLHEDFMPLVINGLQKLYANQ